LRASQIRLYECGETRLNEEGVEAVDKSGSGFGKEPLSGDEGTEFFFLFRGEGDEGEFIRGVSLNKESEFMSVSLVGFAGGTPNHLKLTGVKDVNGAADLIDEEAGEEEGVSAGFHSDIVGFAEEGEEAFTPLGVSFEAALFDRFFTIAEDAEFHSTFGEVKANKTF
jgi:hypothetical protein